MTGATMTVEASLGRKEMIQAPVDLRIEQTIDAEEIKRIITEPRLWKHVADDDGCEPEDFTPNLAYKYFKVLDGDKCLGLFAVTESFSRHCMEVHNCLSPSAIKNEPYQKLIRAAWLVRDWVWSNTDAMRLVGQVPEYNSWALRFAFDCGMQAFGVNPKSWKRHGKYGSTVLVGMTRPEVSNGN